VGLARSGRTVAALGAAAVALTLAAASANAGQLITRVAGTPTVRDYTGDGHQARKATLNLPSDVAPLPHGAFLIADKKNAVIRKVNANGGISTVAGTGVVGFNGDDRRATKTQLDLPAGVAALPHGAFLIADFENHVVRRVGNDGRCHIVAGNGTEGYTGDGHKATKAELSFPARVAPLRGGAFLITDFGANVIRKVDSNGIIHTVAGNGGQGDTGNGGPARQAELNEPANAFPLQNGGMLIAEYGGNIVRKVGANGKIHRIAGTGTFGYNGDEIPARQAELYEPSYAAQIGKNIYVADYQNNRVRKITPDGVIHTAIGDGTQNYSGDGGPPKDAQVYGPTSVNPIPGGHGAYYITDFFNDVVRLIH
jgi:trimeric autotransporter adhesin